MAIRRWVIPPKLARSGTRQISAAALRIEPHSRTRIDTERNMSGGCIIETNYNVVAVRIDKYLRRGFHIPINTRAVDEPQRIGLRKPADGGIIMPVPVVVQAGFELEPLAREARVEHGRAGD